MQIMTIGGPPTRTRAPGGRMLASTDNAVWLWPGTPLTEKRGGRIVPLARPMILHRAAQFYGPAVNDSGLPSTIERAAALLSDTRSDLAQRLLDRAPLPALSPDGAALMRAIAARLGVSAPALNVSGMPRLWSDHDGAIFAPLYDGCTEMAWELEKAFSPGGMESRPPPALGGRLDPRTWRRVPARGQWRRDTSKTDPRWCRTGSRGGGRRCATDRLQ